VFAIGFCDNTRTGYTKLFGKATIGTTFETFNENDKLIPNNSSAPRYTYNQNPV